MEENVLIDTLVFAEGLEPNCEKIKGMFESYHEQQCCEMHWLDFDDFDTAFKAVEKFSKISKIEIKGTPGMGITLFFYEDKDDEDNRVGIFIPGRNSNNGYYSYDLDLTVTLPNGFSRNYSITEYQE